MSVSCRKPVTRMVTKQVPRTVTTTRYEDRSRVDQVTKTRMVPVTKSRTTYVDEPYTESVPYTDYKTETVPVQRFRDEQYTETYQEPRIVTKTDYVQKECWKNCSTTVPVYGVQCNARYEIKTC